MIVGFQWKDVNQQMRQYLPPELSGIEKNAKLLILNS